MRLRSRIFWYLSKKVELHFRGNGYFVFAQFLDLLLTVFFYFGSNWSYSTSPIKIEYRHLKYLLKKKASQR